MAAPISGVTAPAIEGLTLSIWSMAWGTWAVAIRMPRAIRGSRTLPVSPMTWPAIGAVPGARVPTLFKGGRPGRSMPLIK